MTKQEYLEAAEKRYDELQRLNLITDFYDYETEFVKIWQDFGWEVLEKNISKPGNDKRKKNLTTLGYVTINNIHPFSKGKNGFQIPLTDNCWPLIKGKYCKPPTPPRRGVIERSIGHGP